MTQELRLEASIRRYDDRTVYVGFVPRSAVVASPFKHEDLVHAELGRGVMLRGMLRISGADAWLAHAPQFPDSTYSRITALLREAGLERGDRVPARLVLASDAEEMRAEPTHVDSPIETTGTYTRDRDRHRLDAAVCRQRILEYNRERYRGFGTNVEIDERANGLFASGVAATREDLTAQVLFVGEVYGGAQERFLADGYEAEARRITNGLIDGLDQYRHVLAGCRPLLTEIPSVEVLEQLLLPFHATKRWFVWGTKFLALSSPDTFPVVDSRVSTILGLGSSGNMGRRYHGAVQVIREVVEQNLNLLEELRVWDQGRCPSVLKVLDKVLYAEGGA